MSHRPTGFDHCTMDNFPNNDFSLVNCEADHMGTMQKPASNTSGQNPVWPGTSANINLYFTKNKILIALEFTLCCEKVTIKFLCIPKKY